MAKPADKSSLVSLAGKKRPAKTPRVKRESVEEPKRQRRSPAVARGHILDVAKKLLAEHGPDAIGLKAVAQSAGVSHALISHYFGTYDALVEEALHAHLADLREETLQRVAGLVHAGPEEWIDASFDQFTGPVAGRLLAWAILSGRLDKEDFFPRRDQGMKRVADAVQARLTGELGEEAPSREDIEFAMMVNFSTGLGYSVAKQVLWGSFNKEASPERDQWFRKRFAELLTASLPSVDSLAKKKNKRGNTR
jgi:AcrR family transcriptional regulator